MLTTITNSKCLVVYRVLSILRIHRLGCDPFFFSHSFLCSHTHILFFFLSCVNMHSLELVLAALLVATHAAPIPSENEGNDKKPPRSRGCKKEIQCQPTADNSNHWIAVNANVAKQQAPQRTNSLSMIFLFQALTHLQPPCLGTALQVRNIHISPNSSLTQV
jgi:hypothetical protein